MMVAVPPLVPGVTAVMVKMVPGSGSVSLASTGTTLATESSTTEMVSSPAVGASLSVLVTMMVTVATLLVRAPSETV